jgi:hypothetical protein
MNRLSPLDALRRRRRFSSAVQTYRDLIVSRTPVAYWRLGEASGTTATDEMGLVNGNYSGTYTQGETGALFGDANTAVLFAGGWITIGSNATINALTSFTVEIWCRRSGTISNGRAISRRNANVGYALAMDAIGTKMRLLLGTGSALTQLVDTGDMPNNTWTHYAATYNGTQARLYRNGALVVGPTTTSYSSGATSLQISGESGSFTFSGRLDEAAIYGTALSDAQILENYNKGFSG